MNVSENLTGQSRVVIERVSPELDGGLYPIKAVPGDVIAVEADIFADGHDYLTAVLLFKHIDDANWTETAMAPIVNDRWGASFVVEKQGKYLYTLESWVDHPGSWQHEVHLKVADGQRITSELLAGAQYLDGMLVRAGGVAEQKKGGKGKGAKTKSEPISESADAKAIREMAALFRDESRYNEAVSVAESDQFTFYASRYPERQHVTRYSHELGVEVDRARAGFSNWYCLFPRSASRVEGRHGTFKDVEALLPRISGMGFDVLYLPPIHPIGTAHRKGKNNSVICQPGEPGVPYGIGSPEGGHDAIHPELGTVEEFKHLIAIAANYGMEVAMDLAIQCSPDHPWAKEHPEWFKKRPDGTIQYAENPPKKYQDIYPVYFETDDWQNLWEELKRVLIVWASWGVRIVRVDNPHTKPFGFWEWVIAEVKKEFPDMLFLAEAFTRPKVMQELGKRGFAQSYTYYTWRNTKYELEQYMMELTQTEMKYYYRPNFWPTTHDINPYSLQGGHEPQFLIRYFLAATLVSNYGIYGPSFELMEHIPFPNKEEYLNSEKYEIRLWDWDRTNKLTYLITLVNRIRHENAALQITNNIQFCPVNDDAIMAYLKIKDANRLLIVVNTDAYSRRAGVVQVPIWQLGIGPEQYYQVHDLLTGAYYNWQGEHNYVELDPYSLPMHLFRIEV
ncbi:MULTISPECIES: alpha-1,4-glucan--maltose-1-phosphate maltosyltransferase [unclassified Spirosoma]|uniref:alpha-1,4-glucan--maltose-1-phosphate maltosyltransferase n=1 Tax=unclassified Spirosoma TaxID=2621999 RepID=UPI00095C8CBB|nr:MULTISPECIES: alpha-1,4-glucan--maltose-1-phosphate maltosyltransferase [unclassified Spirosoma]MBN8821727.1 alpha-1,4-glucan--maltose-1-phosphate maltosyltransferase [Spirosoma sp.]OJW80779.1 MAG: alpha-1,4-glucan--maltose-1-phosphate maltosyltransferase [Spirosoma sp. 48-14]